MRVFFISVLSSLSVFAHTLNVDILDLHVDDTTVYVALYKPNNKFLSLQDTYKVQTVQANKEHLHVAFNGLENGEYAIALFHDENSNKKLDKNFFGVPKEGYGISNNPKTLLEPTFKDAEFSLQNDKNIKIEVNY